MKYFLGQAANYKGKIAHHLFAAGGKKDKMALRRFLAKKYQVDYEKTALYHTGRSALCAAIKILVPRKSEVLVNGFTCYAVVEAVKKAGCRPVFADIDTSNLHFGEKELKKALKLHPEAKAIIVQNTLGMPADIVGIEKIAKKCGLVIIEDLAHSTGVVYEDGREVGTVGAAAAFSFGKDKSIDTIAGGALILRGEKVFNLAQPEKKSRISDSLRERWYPVFGGIYRGLAKIKLEKVWMGILLKIHFVQRSADAECDIERGLRGWQAKLALEQFKKLPKKGRKPLREFVLVNNREELLAKLHNLGYFFDGFWYEKPVSPERYYKKVKFPEEECPNAVLVGKKIINIPTHYKKTDLKEAWRLIREYQDEK